MAVSNRMRTGQPGRVAGFVRGPQGMAQVEEHERQIAERRNKPFAPDRLWMKPGETKTIIFLDDWFAAESDADAENSGVIVTEHTLEDPATGKRTRNEICLQSVGRNCPHCQGGDTPHMRFISTCYEVGAWTSTKTGETRPGSRRLLAITQNNRDQWLQLQRIAKNNGHTMRGMWIILKRGVEPTSFATGIIQANDEGRLFSLVDEDTMAHHYGHAARYSQRDPSKVVAEANEDLMPVDYVSIFSVEEGAAQPAVARGNAAPPRGLPPALPGSRQEAHSVLDEDDDELPGIEPARPLPPPGASRPALPPGSAGPPTSAPRAAQRPAIGPPPANPTAAPAPRSAPAPRPQEAPQQQAEAPPAVAKRTRRGQAAF